jgi:hypothetical protein
MVTIEVAPPPREASVIDVAVLLLAAIGVVRAFGSALGAVDVEVALGPVDDTDGPPVHTLAGCPVDGTGTVQGSNVRGIAGVGCVLHVKNVCRPGVRGGVADVPIQPPIFRALPIVRACSRGHTHQPHNGQRSNLYCPWKHPSLAASLGNVERFPR